MGEEDIAECRRSWHLDNDTMIMILRIQQQQQHCAIIARCGMCLFWICQYARIHNERGHTSLGLSC